MTDKTNEYNTICQRLDDIIIEYTSLLESYSDSMNHLQSKIKNGHFSLARARRSVGHAFIDSDYFSHYHEPNFNIEIDQNNNDECYSFKLPYSSNEDDGHTRLRNVKKSIKDEDYIELEDNNDSNRNLKKVIPFSLSAGKVMNKAKDDFLSAIKTSIIMANTIRKLMILEKTYIELKQKKDTFDF